MDARTPEVPCGDLLQNAVSDACPRAPRTKVAGLALGYWKGSRLQQWGC